MATVTITINTPNDAERPMTWGNVRAIIAANTPYSDGLEVRDGLSEPISRESGGNSIAIQVADPYVKPQRYPEGTIIVRPERKGGATIFRKRADVWEAAYDGADFQQKPSWTDNDVDALAAIRGGSIITKAQPR